MQLVKQIEFSQQTKFLAITLYFRFITKIFGINKIIVQSTSKRKGFPPKRMRIGILRSRRSLKPSETGAAGGEAKAIG